jgi:inosose dehydratase
MNKNKAHSRREILKVGALATVLPTITANSISAKTLSTAKDKDPWKGLKISIASYSFRKMSIDDTIKAIARLGIKYASLKDAHLPFKTTAEERRNIIKKFNDAGITTLSCGNISIKNDEASVREIFQYAKDAGIPTIVCSPDVEAIPILDKMVKEFDIKIAIHNHGPEDKKYPSPYDAWKVIEKYDKRLGVCIDVGHTARAKVDPAESILKCSSRLYDVHFKDISSTEPNGKTVEAGRGVLDLTSMINALLKIKYQHLVSFEFEKDSDDPLPGVAESVGFTKGLMFGT